jgi:hypothetical protein
MNNRKKLMMKIKKKKKKNCWDEEIVKMKSATGS